MLVGRDEKEQQRLAGVSADAGDVKGERVVERLHDAAGTIAHLQIADRGAGAADQLVAVAAPQLQLARPVAEQLAIKRHARAERRLDDRHTSVVAAIGHHLHMNQSHLTQIALASARRRKRDEQRDDKEHLEVGCENNIFIRKFIRQRLELFISLVAKVISQQANRAIGCRR